MEEEYANGKSEETKKEELHEEDKELVIEGVGEYTNGKLEETKKEVLHEEDKEVVIEGVGEFKSDGADESLKENVVNEDCVDAKETPKDGDDSSSSSGSSSDEESPDSPPDEKSVEVVNLEKLEDEKEGYESVVKSVEPIAPLSEELIPEAEVPVENKDVTEAIELESKEINEHILPSLDENNEFSGAVPVTDVVLEEAVETIISASDGSIGEPSDIVKMASKEIADAVKLPLYENDIKSPGVVDLECKENVDSLLQMPADVPCVDTDKMDESSVEDEIPGSLINQPIISLARRNRQMTSWRSCCGLFDVLRRSDR